MYTEQGSRATRIVLSQFRPWFKRWVPQVETLYRECQVRERLHVSSNQSLVAARGSPIPRSKRTYTCHVLASFTDSQVLSGGSYASTRASQSALDTAKRHELLPRHLGILSTLISSWGESGKWTNCLARWVSRGAAWLSKPRSDMTQPIHERQESPEDG